MVRKREVFSVQAEELAISKKPVTIRKDAITHYQLFFNRCV